MPDCLFCRIVAREIPASIVCETSTTLAFRDIHPKAPTHVLVIPKAHISSMAELDGSHSDLIVDLTRTIQDVAKLEHITSKGFRVVVNNGKAANQLVGHLHYHVLGGRNLEE